MKTFILILWLLFIQLIFPQDNELTIQVTNDPSKTITFELSPIGTVFCNDTDCGFEPISTYSYTSTLTAPPTPDPGDVLCEFNGFNIRYCSWSTSTQITNCA